MFSRLFFLRLTSSCSSPFHRSSMPAKKRKTSLDASANKKRKARDRDPDDTKESPSPQSSVVASIEELPGRVATRKAAAVVDANPPYRQLLETQEHSVESQPGESVVYWMRMDDMRIEHNRALDLAVNHARRYRIPLLVLFVISLGDYKAHDRSPRRIDFMLRNLKILQSSLNILDIPLCIISHTPRTSIPHRVIAQLHEWRATRVFANIEYGVDELRRDIKVITLGREDEPVIEATFVDDKSIVSPGKLATLKGKQYTVYSPWLKAWTDHVKSHPETIRPLPILTANDPHIRSSTSLYHTLFENPVPDFLPGFECVDAEKMAVLWPAGISAARQVFERFLQTRARQSQLGDSSPLADGAETIKNESRLALYKDDRNRCDIDGSSRMSPYLASGVISAQELIRLSMAWTLDSSKTSSAHINTDRTTFLGSYTSEIAWRDFYYHVMCAFPRLSMGRPYLEKFVEVKWETDGKALEKWMQGRTGVPIVDAAMRQANTQGWMHNRARMIAATYLAKDLMIDWRLGEKYFMQQFIDGDLSSNNGGWQWCASTGTDSQPYFRIFNPYTQAEKADPSGDYIRHFVPELKDLEGKALYNPHNHLDAITFERLGYPAPLIDHAEARERALRRYKNPGEL